MSIRFIQLTIAFCCMLAVASTLAGEPAQDQPDSVKVAAVQILGYDKSDVPRPGYDPTEAMVPYINKAGEDGAQLVVFP